MSRHRADEELVWAVARDLARVDPRVNQDRTQWGPVSIEYKEKAQEKINEMTNLELVRLIGDELL